MKGLPLAVIITLAVKFCAKKKGRDSDTPLQQWCKYHHVVGLGLHCVGYFNYRRRSACLHLKLMPCAHQNLVKH